MSRHPGDRFVDDVATPLKDPDLEGSVVCGLSTGGRLSPVLASRHPDRLSGLVLASTFTQAYRSRADRVQRSPLLRAASPPVRRLGHERSNAGWVAPRAALGRRERRLRERRTAPGGASEA